MISSFEHKDTVWNTLRQRYAWPANRPDVTPIPWSMDYGGRNLITNAIKHKKLRLILEIGVFLGGSARQWLLAADDVRVVAVDPWTDLRDLPSSSFIKRHPLGLRHSDQLFAVNGFYKTFLSSMWDMRQRIVPVRGTAAEVLPTLHNLGLQPALIYVDSDKTGEELPLCERLFPNALIGGDDWIWQDGTCFPIRKPVMKLAHRQGRTLKCVDNTWLIDDSPWDWLERRCWLKHLPSSARHHWHAARMRITGRTSSGEPIHRDE